jgi:hypothetical protein
MKTHTFASRGHLPLATLLLTLAAGCGAVEEPGTPPSNPGRTVQQLEEENSLTTNGLATNGLASGSFASWFQQNPELSNQVMKYLVRCAVAAGQTRTHTDSTGTTYTWYGNLGLAPTWAGGSPATVEEQQLVTGCMASLVNKYGRGVNLSVLGDNAAGQPIAYTSAELADYAQREACFFGNIFNDTGVFVGNDQPLLPVSKSSLRACALGSTNSATSSECPPLAHIGTCQASCQLDSTGIYYTRCTRNGVTYRPITTRIRTQEIVACGDGICQPSESCGNTNAAASCGVDCGSCK